ncbi:MAG: HAMP domain-containing sensor histidine kinase [Verrucomicrobiota bacterium]
MRKIAWIFVVSVLGPSLALAWLAVRSLSNQEIVFERQQTLLYQNVCNGVAKDVMAFIENRKIEFGRQVEALLALKNPMTVARQFDALLVEVWPLAQVGFAVTADGEVVSPSLFGRPDSRRFRLENDSFLSNQESVEVYWKSPKGDIPLSQLDGAKGDKFRKVTPEKGAGAEGKVPSRMSAQEAEFKQFIGNASDGILARFLQNKLKLWMWYRSPGNTQVVFGAEIKLPLLQESLRPLLQPERPLQPDICVALLDDTGKPVARSHPEFTADWKRPFVAAEIGEALPHWEVAGYLLNPTRLTHSARTLTLTLGLLVCVLWLAIGVGGSLLVADLRRQLRLTRQKTDFVSNVSHELKTPLTSIRMFSELLADGRVTDPGKQRTYLQVFAGETALLTLLINNVLDFSRMERGEKQYRLEPCDIGQIAREVAETARPHLEARGFHLIAEWPDGPVHVRADRDALAQVILNLLSNAEKYSGESKEIRLQLRRARGVGGESVELRVLDRGIGVPAGLEERIFEQFYRADDSLSSGIPGSGLGLTLARQIARSHGGEIHFERRSEGGSCFILRLPI